MRFYLVNVFKLGAYLKHPDVGHKNYKNAGYNLEMTKCIWVAEDGVNMQADGVTEITQTEAENYLAQWEQEKQAAATS